jgi:hypothetical protein
MAGETEPFVYNSHVSKKQDGFNHKVGQSEPFVYSWTKNKDDSDNHAKYQPIGAPDHLVQSKIDPSGFKGPVRNVNF